MVLRERLYPYKLMDGSHAIEGGSLGGPICGIAWKACVTQSCDEAVTTTFVWRSVVEASGSANGMDRCYYRRAPTVIAHMPDSRGYPPRPSSARLLHAALTELGGMALLMFAVNV